MSREARITVVQVFRLMGIPPIKDYTWPVGQRMERLWRAEFGRRPNMDLHPKTNGSGSHDLADYPASWQPRIERVIEKVVGNIQRQQGLFDGPVTTWEQRFTEALSALCKGAEPPPEAVRDWFDNDKDSFALQEWAIDNAPHSWMQGIVIIDAAQVLADTPEEGVNHAARNEPKANKGSNE